MAGGRGLIGPGPPAPWTQNQTQGRGGNAGRCRRGLRHLGMPTTICWPSVASLLLIARANGNDLSTATGFVVQRDDCSYLITNWHVVAGRSPVTNANLHPSGAWPDELVIVHNAVGQLGQWVPRTEPLHDSNSHPRWLEHPVHGRRVDVVALPLSETTGVELHSYDPWEAGQDFALGVSTGLSIVGFPFGLTGGGAFGIWVQGTIATEPEVDFDGVPCFLIDSRTRQGQSGSPVLFYARGGMVPMADGSTAMFAGEVRKLMGVYSGRINDQSDLGIVWKASVVPEIVAGLAQGSA